MVGAPAAEPAGSTVGDIAPTSLPGSPASIVESRPLTAPSDSLQQVTQALEELPGGRLCDGKLPEVGYGFDDALGKPEPPG